MVIESTGVFNTDVGVVSIYKLVRKGNSDCTGKGDGVGTYVVGVNADTYSHEDFDILSNASCTTTV